MTEIKLTLCVQLTKLKPDGVEDRILRIPVIFQIEKDEHFEGCWVEGLDNN